MKTITCVELKSDIFTLLSISATSETEANVSKGRLYIKEFIQLPVPENDFSGVTQKIKETLEDKGLNNNEVIVIASELEAVFKKIYIPIMPSKEIKKAVMWQVSPQLPFEMEKCIFGYKVLGRQKDRDGAEKIAVLTGAIEKEKADRITNFIFEVGLLPIHLIHPVTVLSLLLDISSAAEGTVIFLDIANKSSWFRVYKETEFQFERELEIGEDDLNRMLMSTGTAREQLEYFKKEYGLLTMEDMNKTDLENIPIADMGRQARTFVERLTIELRRALKQWVGEYESGVVNKMYLMGNLSHFRHLAAYLSNELGFSVIPVDSSSLGLQVFSHDGQDKIDMAKLGYCLGAVLYKQDELDFLPLSLKIQKRLNQVKLGIRIGLGAITATLLFLYLIGQSYVFILKNNIKNKKYELEKIKGISAEFGNLLKKHQQLAQQITFYYSISGNQSLLSSILKELTNITPPEIVFEKMVIDEDMLLIEGIVIQLPESTPEISLAQFMKEIEDSPFFEGVSLLNLQDYIGKETQGRHSKSFSLQAQFYALPVEEVLKNIE